MSIKEEWESPNFLFETVQFQVQLYGRMVPGALSY